MKNYFSTQFILRRGFTLLCYENILYFNNVLIEAIEALIIDKKVQVIISNESNKHSCENYYILQKIVGTIKS